MRDTIKKLMLAAALDTYQGIVSEAQVSEIESQTGCVLPTDYVEFLRTCGFAFWEGHAINGVFDECDPRFPKSYNFSAITQTSRARHMHSRFQYPYYDSALVVGKDDMGGYFLLISRSTPAASGVVWVNLEEEWVITESWDSFTDFLDSQLADV